MSDAPRNGNGAAVVTWRATVGFGLSIVGALALFILDIVKDTAKTVSTVAGDVREMKGDFNARINANAEQLRRMERQLRP